MLTVAEAAHKTGASERTIREHCDRKTFAGAVKIGTGNRAVWLIPETDLDGFKAVLPGNPAFGVRLKPRPRKSSRKK